ncbi:MAG: FAD-dependent oxidoreductase [Bacteroidetes bacterium QS_8_68_15]|nr:MAG: FAD-dependent oxidoreductase [Bacteroidetes bacterium QS_8_68_15]
MPPAHGPHVSSPEHDAVIVGGGPNGLAAAITLAEAGRSVLVLEANDTIGGAARTGELTEPGFRHDLGSAIHPLGVASPFLRRLPLEKHGLEWIWPELPAAHPLPGGRAALQHHALGETAAAFEGDGANYRRFMAPLLRDWKKAVGEILQPVLHVPHAPVVLARFGLRAIWPARPLAKALFRSEEARALIAGHAAHSNLPLSAPGSAAFGLILAVLAHAVGWPLPRGGAQSMADALALHLRALGGEIRTGHRVRSLAEDVPPARAVLFDTAPRQLAGIASEALPNRYRRRLRSYRRGPAAFKMDFALSEPIPWKNADCAKAGTVHVCGTLGEVAASEQAVDEGRAPERPFVLLAQHSLFDDTRAPGGKHTAWAYAHVPNGWDGDREKMAARLTDQIERFAPGFREVIEAQAIHAPADLERQNAALVGGDINGGAMDLAQLIARPTLSLPPYRTPTDGLYLCSASTPPGGGVHGMCGHLAAKAALRRELR